MEDTFERVAYKFYFRYLRLMAKGREAYLPNDKALFRFDGWTETFLDFEGRGINTKNEKYYWAAIRSFASRPLPEPLQYR